MLSQESKSFNFRKRCFYSDIFMVIFHVFADEALSIALIRGSITWLIRDIFMRTDSVFLRAKTDKSKHKKKSKVFSFPLSK